MTEENVHNELRQNLFEGHYWTWGLQITLSPARANNWSLSVRVRKRLWLSPHCNSASSTWRLTTFLPMPLLLLGRTADESAGFWWCRSPRRFWMTAFWVPSTAAALAAAPNGTWVPITKRPNMNRMRRSWKGDIFILYSLYSYLSCNQHSQESKNESEIRADWHVPFSRTNHSSRQNLCNGRVRILEWKSERLAHVSESYTCTTIGLGNVKIRFDIFEKYLSEMSAVSLKMQNMRYR